MLHWVLIVAATAAGAAPPTLREPLQGAIVAGNVLAAVKDHEGYVVAWTTPLMGRSVARKVNTLAASPSLPTRWSAGHGAIWLGNAESMSAEGMTFHSRERLDRRDLQELLKGRVLNDPADKVEPFSTYFAPRDPASNVRSLSLGLEFEPEQHYDNLPVGRYAVRQVILTNVRGRAVPGGEAGALSTIVLDITPEEATNPRWSFTVYSYVAQWDYRTHKYRHGTWKKVETIDVAFREPFRVLSRGEDYYFLTSSGALYRAPKPAKGRHRKMLPVWVNRRDPITAFIKDVDRDRTFLFHGPRERPAVFEMAEGVRDRPYDPKLFVTGKEGPDALRRVVGYSRVLLALGMVNRK